MTIWTCELNETDELKYEQIAASIERDIAAGVLKPGDRLPPQRKLAKRLSVTIGTIGRGYALAEKRGLIVSEIGRGSFVAASTLDSELDSKGRLIVDLGINLPPEVPDNRPFENTINELGRQRDLSKFFGALPVEGLIHHRIAAANWMSRRIECTEADVLICTGTQSALISSLAVLTQPGDSVLVESLTFPGIITALKLLRLNPITIAMDAEGILPESVENAIRQSKVLCINPTNHNPTTSTLGIDRRKSIAEIAKRNGTWVIEDDTYGNLIESGPPTLSSLIPEQSILISSLSKTLSVGLRLAILRAPASIRPSVVTKFQATSFFPSSLSVEIASRWIDDGTGDQFISARIEIARRRLQMAYEILGRENIQGSPQLNHIWVDLPETWTANSLSHAASENGVIVLPSKIFSPTGFSERNSIRIGLGAARNEAELRVGLEKISRLLQPEDQWTSARF